MLALQYPALVDEATSLQTPLNWLGHSASHGMVLKPLELSCLIEEFGVSMIPKRLEPCDCFKLLDGCGLHGACDNMSSLVLRFAHLIEGGLGCIASCRLAVLQYWSHASSIQSLESHSIRLQVMPTTFFSACCFKLRRFSKVTPRYAAWPFTLLLRG